MRAFLALVLSLVLALGSVSMAVARGQTPMGDTLALCIDGAAVTITLDAEGNPVSTAPHLCPDCISAATAFVLPTLPGLPAPVWRTWQADTRAPAPGWQSAAALIPLARGPPALSV
ncbi:MAG: hypothetical protein E6Q73_09265 [Pseudorhodobacter sp.]|nr:MAG: hypothetical protein E6Q73_09265 [Pseudorhodobacter sp.]